MRERCFVTRQSTSTIGDRSKGVPFVTGVGPGKNHPYRERILAWVCTVPLNVPPVCRSCGESTYNPDGDIYWNCLMCTVCSESGMLEVQPCTVPQDTKCSNTVMQDPKRFAVLYWSPNSHENVQARQKREGEEPHRTRKADVLMAVVVTGAVALIVYVIYDKRQILLRKCMGNPMTLETEETTPLHTGQMEPTYPDSCDLEKEGGPGEADDHLGSIRDIRISISYRLDKQVGQDEKETCKRGIPALQRQLSHPVTNTEVGNTEQQLDEQRPNTSWIMFLSKLLAPNQKYKDFANQMGLETHTKKRLEEETGIRNWIPEDISYAYTARALQCKPKLRFHDIYDALNDLGLFEECANLREKRNQVLDTERS